MDLTTDVIFELDMVGAKLGLIEEALYLIKETMSQETMDEKRNSKHVSCFVERSSMYTSALHLIWDQIFNLQKETVEAVNKFLEQCKETPAEEAK